MTKREIAQSATNNRTATLFAWVVTFLVVAVAIIGWGTSFKWHPISLYQIFPLFGLVAFSLMWAMQAVGTVSRVFFLDTAGLKPYYRFIPWVILVAVIAHPALLSWQLWNDGAGWPPDSYINHYVAPSLRWAVILSSTAWLIFIAYELKYKFQDKPWWKYMVRITDLAFVGIFFHALALGSQLQHGWLRIIWYFYGVTLLIFLIEKYTNKNSKNLIGKIKR